MRGGADAEEGLTTKLMWAAWHGNAALVESLLGQAGKSDGNGETALMWAARGDRTYHSPKCKRGKYDNCINFLLRTNRETRKQNQRGETALMWAARSGYRERVELLLPHECGIATEYGWTALIWAASYNQQNCIEQLMQNDRERYASCWTNLIYYAASGKRELLEAELAGEENQLTCDAAGRTALIYAAACGHDGILDLLIEKGDGMVDRYKRTALMSAACTGQRRCIETLKRYQLHEQDNNGWTALMWAVYECEPRCVDLLREEGGKEANGYWRGFKEGTKAIDIARRKLEEARRKLRGAGEGAPAPDRDNCDCRVNVEELNRKVEGYSEIINILSDERDGNVEEEANGD